MILVDTGPLVALCDARDAMHGTALKELDALAADRLLTCEAVLVETCFHLPYAHQRQRLRALLRDLNIEPAFVSDDPPSWLEVFDWLIKYAEHEPDWADACLAVLSGSAARMKVWTYDRKFQTMWRRPNGTPVPLAVRSGRTAATAASRRTSSAHSRRDT